MVRRATNSSPLVSAVIATWNYERYIEECVSSLLRQTLEDFELIVVDDGSTDATAEIVARFQDPRIRYEPRSHQGVASAVNHGLDLARGRYVARMDADDVAHPERFARQVAFLEAHEDVGIVGSNYMGIDANGRGNGAWSNYEENDLQIRWSLIFSNPFAQPTVMLRRAVLEKHGLRYDETFRAAIDQELWTRLLAVTKAANLPQYLLAYRRHAAQITEVRNEEQSANHGKVVERTLRSFGFRASAIAEILHASRVVRPAATIERHRMEWSLAKFKGTYLGNVYMDLLEWFVERNSGTAGVDEFYRREVRRMVQAVLKWPSFPDHEKLFRRLGKADASLASTLARRSLEIEAELSGKPSPPGAGEARSSVRNSIDTFDGPESTLLISGAARSGTTWLAEVLNQDCRSRLIFEPFLPHAVPLARIFPPYPYVPPDCEDPARVQAALAILRGEVRADSVHRGNPCEVSRRRIVKDVRTNLMLAWLHRLMPGMPIVLLIRNPYAVARSRDKMQWQTHLDDLLAQGELVRDHPRIAEVAESIDRSDSFQQMIFLWAVLHYVPLRQLPPGAVVAVCYENLILRPEHELRRLCCRLGRPFDPGALDHVVIASKTTTFQRNFTRRRDRMRMIFGHQRDLSGDDIRRGQAILGAFGLADWYDEDSGLPTASIPFDACAVDVDWRDAMPIHRDGSWMRESAVATS